MTMVVPAPRVVVMRKLSVPKLYQEGQLFVQPVIDRWHDLAGVTVDQLGYAVDPKKTEFLHFEANAANGLDVEFAAGFVGSQCREDNNGSVFASVVSAAVSERGRNAQPFGKNGNVLFRGWFRAFNNFLAWRGRLRFARTAAFATYRLQYWRWAVGFVMGIVVRVRAVCLADVPQGDIKVCWRYLAWHLGWFERVSELYQRIDDGTHCQGDNEYCHAAGASFSVSIFLSVVLGFVTEAGLGKGVKPFLAAI
jgi:hypothetical protein